MLTILIIFFIFGYIAYKNAFRMSLAKNDGIDRTKQDKESFCIRSNISDRNRESIISTRRISKIARHRVKYEVLYFEDFEDSFPPAKWEIIDWNGTSNEWQQTDTYSRSADFSIG